MKHRTETCSHGYVRAKRICPHCFARPDHVPAYALTRQPPPVAAVELDSFYAYFTVGEEFAHVRAERRKRLGTGAA